MSADSEDESGPQDSWLSAEPSRPNDQEGGTREEGPYRDEEEDGDWSEGRVRDCVVCQNAAVNRVLLPCRHACVCDGCVSHFQHCPMCRAFVLESFALTQRTHTNSTTATR